MNWQRAALWAFCIGVLPVLCGCSSLCCDNIPDSQYDHQRDVSSSWCRKCPCIWPPEGKTLDEGEVALTPTWNKVLGCGDKRDEYYYTKGPADCLYDRQFVEHGSLEPGN